VKSLEPTVSAFACNGARPPAANEKAGAKGDSGPTSRKSRFRTPRAGRPVKTLVTAIPSSEIFSSEAALPNERYGEISRRSDAIFHERGYSAATGNSVAGRRD
jgi:hypothetical protein